MREKTQQFVEILDNLFHLDLPSRYGSSVVDLRPGLSVVSQCNQSQYIEFMNHYAIEPEELIVESRGANFEEHAIEFVPTIMLDFTTRRVYCSHPDRAYFNYRDDLPKDWSYFDTGVNELLELFPEALHYWK